MSNAKGHAATLKPFKAGESGNRAGAPPGKRITLRFCRARSLAMAKVLVAVAEDVDAPPAARVSAATAILDRAWGKPERSVDVQLVGSGTARLEVAFVDPGDLRHVINGRGHDDESDERLNVFTVPILIPS